MITVSSGLSLRLRRSSKTYLVRKDVNGKPQFISLGQSEVALIEQGYADSLSKQLKDCREEKINLEMKILF